MSNEMDFEDYYHQQVAEIAALKEQIDNLVAMVCGKDREIASLSDRLKRMTEALDEALVSRIVRGMQARKAELEAGL